MVSILCRPQCVKHKPYLWGYSCGNFCSYCWTLNFVPYSWYSDCMLDKAYANFFQSYEIWNESSQNLWRNYGLSKWNNFQSAGLRIPSYKFHTIMFRLSLHWRKGILLTFSGHLLICLSICPSVCLSALKIHPTLWCYFFRRGCSQSDY